VQLELHQILVLTAILSRVCRSSLPRCKLFYMKDGSYVDRGVGHVHLKPVPSSAKTQLVVRAETSLGNLLLNIILNPAMPVSRQGKNNVAISCLPNPPLDGGDKVRVGNVSRYDKTITRTLKLKMLCLGGRNWCSFYVFVCSFPKTARHGCRQGAMALHWLLKFDIFPITFSRKCFFLGFSVDNMKFHHCWPLGKEFIPPLKKILLTHMNAQTFAVSSQPNV